MKAAAQRMEAVLLLLSLFIYSATALFYQPPYKMIPYPGLKLAAADRLGVVYTSIAQDTGKAASFSGFALSLNAKFGPMSESSFQTLQRQYCGWSETKSRVTYSKDRAYTLIDFLPPVMQAVNGLHFQSSRSRLQGQGLPSFVGNRIKKFDMNQEVLLTSNCWGFAWEVLFQADNADVRSITISTADPTSAWREFTSPAFDLIQSSRTLPPKLLTLSETQYRNRKLRSGDVLLIWHQNPPTTSGTDLYLDHVATLIDDDVYFEKSGSGDRVPFRVNTWAGIVANFPPSIFFWEWRRLVRNNPLSPKVYGSPQTRLRPAIELFGIDSQLSAIDSSYASSTRLDRFSLLSKLRPSIAKRISLQASTDDDGLVESQTYTGILMLEDLRFDAKTGRARLPTSAYTPEWYVETQQVLLSPNKSPYH
jgi:hypothetical protein